MFEDWSEVSLPVVTQAELMQVQRAHCAITSI